MRVYRITLAKYSRSLHASGMPARWNSKDVRMIYTAASRALACLENLVHRNALGLDQLFRTMVIDIPDDLVIKRINSNSLPLAWQAFANYQYTQKLGDAWIAGRKSAVLQVPSALIPQEFNYLINPDHPDFKKIRLVATESFVFDPRIKS